MIGMLFYYFFLRAIATDVFKFTMLRGTFKDTHKIKHDILSL